MPYISSHTSQPPHACPMSPQVNRTAGVKLSRQWLNFTEHQDLQLSLGLDLDWAGTARQAAGSSSSRALGGVKPVGSLLN